MKKRCAHCRTPNEPEAMTCSTCSGDLTYAEEVYGDAATAPAPEGAGSDPRGEDSQSTGADTGRPGGCESENRASTEPCTCRFPQEVPGTGACFSCGGRLPESGNAPDGAAGAGRRTRSEPQLRVEGIGHIPLGSGVLVGRDATYVRAEVATMLATSKGVSRWHVWVGADNGEALMMDLASLNGTWASGVRLTPWRLHRVPFAALPVTLRLGASFTAFVDLGGRT